MKYLGLSIGLIATALFAGACNGSESGQADADLSGAAQTGSKQAGSGQSGSGQAGSGQADSRKSASNQSGVSSSSKGSGKTRPQTREQPVDPQQSCSTDPIQWAIGIAATDETVQRAKAESGATSVRVLRPGLAVTQEFKYGRLNINVDDSNVITSVSCW
ncbi:I78 family peptidase inhibitor [Microbaculum marinum]|uniref:I78 family peptidase inhibitor n=1 Tax=Microbaculum marinum TaxID=1764581 RepID=A0AAW9RG92_9HYPH